MKKLSALLAVLMVQLFAGVTAGHPATIYVFDNAGIVDTSGGTSAESDNMQAALLSFGHTVVTFTGTDAASWTAAGLAADVILLPETENSGYSFTLTGGAAAALQNYVAGGGGFITAYDFNGNFMDPVFGTSLTNSGCVGGASAIAAAAGGTAFAGGPASLPANNATCGFSLASLAASGGASIYQNGVESTVSLFSYGSGAIVHLGWDWFNAAPTGTQNGGWNEVLNRAVTEVTAAPAAVPEPTSLLLLGTGVAGVLAKVRRRKAKSA